MGIINDAYSNNVELDICYLDDYMYEEILYGAKNKQVADEIWNEINFCKLMTELKPPKYLEAEDSHKLIRIIE